MNNLFANTPFSGTAKKSASFSGIAAITGSSVGIIFSVGSPLKSYVPGRSINGISGFERGKGYYIMPKVDMDLTDYFLISTDMVTLTDAATINWDVQAGPLARVAIAADRTLNVTNMQNGDTGILQVEHSAAGTELTLPGTTKDGFAWKTGSGETTVIGFIYTTSRGFLWFNDGFATT